MKYSTASIRLGICWKDALESFIVFDYSCFLIIRLLFVFTPYTPRVDGAPKRPHPPPPKKKIKSGKNLRRLGKNHASPGLPPPRPLVTALAIGYHYSWIVEIMFSYFYISYCIFN